MKQLPLDNLEKAVGHQFANRGLLQQALTHSSFARENPELAADGTIHDGPFRDNEQLEFLGDSVLQLVASQELFQRYPSYQEGELSKLRAHLVNGRHLVSCARELALENYLRLGRSVEKPGRPKASMMADALEALIAALYLDGGLSVARAFVLSHILDPELQRLSNSEGGVLIADPKSRLQEILQASGRPGPRYEMVAEQGPAHHKSFTMQVIVLNAGNETEFAAEGCANTKKAASQLAAQKALERLQGSTNE
jgi:ribonuclease-3